MKDVFVTYAWGGKNEQVYAFVKMLREHGYNATCDRKENQERNAASFTQIMSQGLKSEKVIVILSEEYRKKTEILTSGVSKEYEIIDSDRRKPENKWKYIFVSFDGVSENAREKIVPTMFRGINILDLKADEKNNFCELFARLNEEETVDFGEVGENIPRTEQRELPKFSCNADAKEEAFFHEKQTRSKTFLIVKEGNSIDDRGMLRQFLYEWLLDNDLNFSIQIYDVDIAVQENELSRLREKNLAGERLTQEEDMAFPLLVNQVKAGKRELKLKEKALEIFFTNKNICDYVSGLNVENLMRIITAVIFPESEENGGKNIGVEIFNRELRKKDLSPVFFRAWLKESELREMLLRDIQYRPARIWDVGMENVLFRIIPRFLYFLAENAGEQNPEMEKLEGYWLGLM